jgi:hypothetical protein
VAAADAVSLSGMTPHRFEAAPPPADPAATARFELLENEYVGSQMHFDREQIVRRFAEIMSLSINRAISQRDAALTFPPRASRAGLSSGSSFRSVGTLRGRGS